MSRFDAQRSAATPHALPPELHLAWSRQLPPLEPAWPEQAKMQLDGAYDPIVLGSALYLSSSRHDGVRALDLATGAEKWTYVTDGPVRFAPVGYAGRIYFTSDDGHLYCVDASTGELRWKFRGGLAERRILGNERIISTWPARGAPVIADDTVYFAASIWPFMGIFVHALDARTGEVRWTNDADGSVFMKQPHSADSFAGVAPQGPLVVAGNLLLLPGGRSIPACFDRKTGKMLKYLLAENGKRGGGSLVAAMGSVFFNGGALFELPSEKFLAAYGAQMVLTPELAFTTGFPKQNTLRVYDLKNAGMKKSPATATTAKWVMDELLVQECGPAEAMIRAGDRLYLGGAGSVECLELDLKAQQARSAWKQGVRGQIVQLAAGGDRLIAVSREGTIYCFGPDKVEPRHHPWSPSGPEPSPQTASQAQRLLSAARQREGFCILWGVGDGTLARELVRQSELRVFVVEPDARKVAQARKAWIDEDLYGPRLAIVEGTPLSAHLPPYLATLSVCADVNQLGVALSDQVLARMYASVRPYGGVLCLTQPQDGDQAAGRVKSAELENAVIRKVEEWTLLCREGALAGSANWTHEHADAANTRVSKDQLVLAPLGVLWFGGPSNEGILPRHGHGPQPQVIDGRMIIEGADLLRAIDIYTGRLLWETKIPNVGAYYNNVAHQPGANARGSNFVSTSDGIYVLVNRVCLRLDPATGKRVDEFTLPALSGKTSPMWGFLNVADRYLIAGADPNFDPKLMPPEKQGSGDDKEPGQKDSEPAPATTLGSFLRTLKAPADNLSSSRRLVVLDRYSGEVLWTASARAAFRHNSICAGGGRVYAIDRPGAEALAKMKRDKVEPPAPRVVAFDLKSGKELWAASAEVFGTWLSYSEKYDVLVEAGRVSRDSLPDEPKGMRAYRGSSGEVLWFEKAYTGPAMLHDDTILQGQGACHLLTGEHKLREDPITGDVVPWFWSRAYGCNTPAASAHLLTFRSGAAGYYDYCHDGGTGNFGGFRSSCTNNLIVAGGVLTAPEYTRTCTCAYQNQSSIGLVHMPEAEMWTYFGTKEVSGTVRRLGVNLGAAGDRRAKTGTLWLEYPSVAGASPMVPLNIKPSPVQVQRRHASTVTGPYPWVASSWAANLQELTIGLKDELEDAGRKYTVRLVFMEPEPLRRGQRLMDIQLQGRTVQEKFDILAEVDAPFHSVIKEYTGIEARGTLTLRLAPSPGASMQATVLSGIEIVAEDRK